jgi:hypothetical protein
LFRPGDTQQETDCRKTSEDFWFHVVRDIYPVGSMKASRSRRRQKCGRLHVEFEKQHVAAFDDVFLAFHPVQPFLAGGSNTAGSKSEANDAGRLRSAVAQALTINSTAIRVVA